MTDLDQALEMTPEGLWERLKGPDGLLLLDVRNPHEFLHWRIEGPRHVSMENLPYFTFVEDEDSSCARLPRDREVVVVCGQGGASAFVAELLRARGVSAKNLAGGMVAWGQLHHATRVSLEGGDGLEVFQVNRVGKGCLSYLIASQGEAAVVDPSRQIDRYLALAEARGVEIRHVFDTHLHADHLSGGRRLADRVGALYHASPADLGGAAFPFEPILDGQRVRLGATAVAPIVFRHTPGHTPGSVTLLVGGELLLTGDTLFVEGVGRPDLGGQAEAWARDLYRSLFTALAGLPDHLRILPAHYSSMGEVDGHGLIASTLGALRRSHQALTLLDAEAFVRHVLGQLSPQPEAYREIRQVNLGLVEVEEERALELELGKNACAVSQARAT